MAIAANPRRIPMTREQFEQLPEGPPFYDYINGEAVEVNRPSARHQDIVVCLSFVLQRHARKNNLGMVATDIDVALPTGNVVGPDIAFLAAEHIEAYDEAKGDIYGAPDVIVEVSSPSTAAYDRTEKMALYERAGVPLVWLVDQDTLVIEEFQWTQDGYLRVGAVAGGQALTPKCFPDLTINLAELLAQ